MNDVIMFGVTAAGKSRPVMLDDEGNFRTSEDQGAIGAMDDPAAIYGDASVIAALKGQGVAIGGALVTPSDTQDLAFVARGLWVGGAGDLKLKLVNGDIIPVDGIPAGTFLPFAVLRVYASGQTGTIASKITALK